MFKLHDASGENSDCVNETLTRIIRNSFEFGWSNKLYAVTATSYHLTTVSRSVIILTYSPIISTRIIMQYFSRGEWLLFLSTQLLFFSVYAWNRVCTMLHFGLVEVWQNLQRVNMQNSVPGSAFRRSSRERKRKILTENSLHSRIRISSPPLWRAYIFSIAHTRKFTDLSFFLSPPPPASLSSHRIAAGHRRLVSARAHRESEDGWRLIKVENWVVPSYSCVRHLCVCIMARTRNYFAVQGSDTHKEKRPRARRRRLLSEDVEAEKRSRQEPLMTTSRSHPRHSAMFSHREKKRVDIAVLLSTWTF